MVRLFRNKTNEWYHIHVNGEEIICTGGHPFYLANLDKFIPAKELKLGDTLLLSDNTCVIIEEIQVEQLSKPETTYNFEVEDFHTYYVTDSKVLVHNKCNVNVNENADETAVIGKMKDLDAYQLKRGEYRVADMLPDLGNPKSNWKQNSGVLRKIMKTGNPIRDVSAYPMSNSGFLGAERNLLLSKGWLYNKGFWIIGG